MPPHSPSGTDGQRLAEPRRPARGRGAGFTLVEMLVVLVILGLAVSLIVARGPGRSAALDDRAAAALVAQTLRGARAQAIAGNRAVLVVFDARAHAFGVAGGPVQALPGGVAVSVAAPGGGAGPGGGIGFAPDGSSSGGEVRLDGRGRRITVAVNWLTGRVGVSEAVP